jgi:hypothetical protein
MDEWYDILPFVSNQQIVWWAQCSQLDCAIATPFIQRSKWKQWGFTQCAENGDVEGVRYLVERCGANIHTKNYDVHAHNDFALVLASKNGCMELVQYLVENGADVHSDDDWALVCASRNGHLEVVRYLVEKGADVHEWNEPW